jgi:two-component system, response regulator PdtaR
MKPLSILIAEDEVLTRKDIKAILERGGYAVCAECGNGLKAVEIAKTLSPDLAILDIKMPGDDGLEVARVLYGLNIPVIMMTAYSQQQYISRAENIHVCGYLVKPVSEHSVLATVKIAYSRWQEMQAANRKISEIKDVQQQQKVIDRSKEPVAEREQTSPIKAHRLLTKEAMERRISLGETVKAIIDETDR